MSSSKSAQSQEQHYTDNRSVLGEGAISGGRDVSTTTFNSNYVVDNGTVAGAFNLGSDALGLGEAALGANTKNNAQAFDFAADANAGAAAAIDRAGVRAWDFGTDALGFGEAAMNAGGKTTAQAFNLAGDSLGFGEAAMGQIGKANAGALNLASDALGFGDSAMARAGQAQAQAFNFGSDALGFGEAAMGHIGKSNAQAFDFAGDALGTAGQLAGTTMLQSLGQAFGFGADTQAGALDAINRTQVQAFNFGGDALALSESIMDRALDYGTASTSAALDNLQATQKLTADAYNDAKGRGAMTDKLLLGAIAAMALVAFMAVKK